MRQPAPETYYLPKRSNKMTLKVREHTLTPHEVVLISEFDGEQEARIDLNTAQVDELIVWLMYWKKYHEEKSG